MFRKNPLVELELNYLRHNRPHPKRHYFLLALALLVALTPLFYLFTHRDGFLVQAMAFVILSVYWFVQWLIMKAAVISVNHELPDEMLGSYSNREIIQAKLWAVLRHYRGFIVLVSIAALGLSLAVMGYFQRDIAYDNTLHEFVFNELGFFRYFRSSINLMDIGRSILFPHVLELALAFSVLLSLAITNTLLTITFSISLAGDRLALSLRCFFLIALFAVFLALFSVRDKSFEPNIPTQAWSCSEGYIESDYYCQTIYSQHLVIRILESLQSSTFSFLDAGVMLTSSLLCPSGYDIETIEDDAGRNYMIIQNTVIGNQFSMSQFEWRQLGVVLVTMLSQLSLSAVLLWRTSRSMGKKKK